MNRLIILDRDGVINHDSDDYIKSLEEWVPIAGSVEAIARLSRAGFQIAVATNQSGLGRGYFSQSTLDAMHSRLNELVNAAGGKIASIHYCPHTPEQDCNCRKPKPGLIQQIQDELKIPVKDAFIVGDSIRDLEAGIAMGCKPILVKTGKGSKSIGKLTPNLGDVQVFENLEAFADFILQQGN